MLEVLRKIDSETQRLQKCTEPKKRIEILKRLLTLSNLLEKAVQKNIRTEIGNYEYDNLDPIEKMELDYAFGLEDKFNKWADEYKHGRATIEEGGAIREKYFQALATLKEKRLLNLYIRLASQRLFN